MTSDENFPQRFVNVVVASGSDLCSALSLFEGLDDNSW